MDKQEKDKEVVIDKNSGSMAYNRLDMQVSQALCMAINEFYSLDYLLVMDYYDDITLFDKDDDPKEVSYFQMKTSEESIRLTKGISEDWFVKMYTQLDNKNWIVKELGLITNCPLVIYIGKNKKSFKSEKTLFLEFDSKIIQSIKENISKKKGISIDSVDLTKFSHIRVYLPILGHREIVEQKMGSFLQNKYPKITLESVKTIYASMIDILTKRQSCEIVNKFASFCEVRNKKGVSKKDFERIIEEAMLISIPTFKEILKILEFKEEDKYKVSYEYTSVLEDSQTKSETFTVLFRKIRTMIKEHPRDKDKSIKQYCEELYDILQLRSPDIEIMYNLTYVSILIVSIVLSEMRRNL